MRPTSIRDDLEGCLHHIGRTAHPAVHAGSRHAEVARRNSPSAAAQSPEVHHHTAVLVVGNPVGRTLAVRNLEEGLVVGVLGRSSGGIDCMGQTCC